MGGRGSYAGGDTRQLTIELLQKRVQIQGIIEESDQIRATQTNAVGGGVGGAGQLSSTSLNKCSCCDQLVLRPGIEFEKCPVCGWINDPHQNSRPNSLEGKNDTTLNQAREKWQEGQQK